MSSETQKKKRKGAGLKEFKEIMSENSPNMADTN